MSLLNPFEMKILQIIIIVLSTFKGMYCQSILDTVTSDSIHKAEWLEGQTYPGIYEISIVELIANPDKYENKTVTISGYLHLEFEGNAIYFRSVDYEIPITKNGFAIRLNDYVRSEIIEKEFCDHYVRLTGIFNSKDNGHGGSYSGSIDAIYSIVVIDSN